MLPRLIGQGRARRLLLSGETIGAAEALAWGLVDSVAPADGLDAAVARLAQPMLAAGPHAIRLQKSLILDWEELPAETAITRGIDVVCQRLRYRRAGAHGGDGARPAARPPAQR